MPISCPCLKNAPGSTRPALDELGVLPSSCAAEPIAGAGSSGILRGGSVIWVRPRHEANKMSRRGRNKIVISYVDSSGVMCKVLLRARHRLLMQ